MNNKKIKTNKFILGFAAWLTFLLCTANVSKAQIYYQQGWFGLHTNLSGHNRVYIARDYISLTNGFEYTSTNGNGLDLKINENLLIPTSYFPSDSINAETRDLNLGLTVGSIPGAFNVSLDGAATYSIPIAVPPGTNGMAPSLSVSYNSMAGNGLLGMGFNLSATSAIGRCGENLFNDDEVKGITFGATDKFMLDGQRLVVTNNGVYGADGTEYSTENEGFSKIISYGNIGNGPEKFIVYTRDGKTMEYGYTTDSRIEAQGRTDGAVLNWQLNKITDVNGNYILFSYVEDNSNGEYRLEKIDYTGNTAQNISPYNSVKFVYETRADYITNYVSGSQVRQSYLLKYIRTFNENALVKQYQFNYTRDMYSHLNEVVESSGDETKLNSTVFSWGANTVTYTKNPTNIPLPTKESNYTGDFNGDGKQELIKVRTYNNTFTLYNYNVSTGGFVEQQTFNLDSDFKRFITADFDADGVTELLLIRETSHTISVIKYLPTVNDFVTLHNIEVVSVFKMKCGDFNGDGSTDIYIPTLHKIAGYSLKSNGNWEWDENLITNITGGYSGVFNSDMAFDYNGDGKAEIETTDGQHLGLGSLVKTPSGTYVFEQNMILPFYGGYLSVIESIISQGDFNGDGKMDIIFFDNEDKKKMGISNGKTFVIKNSLIPEDQAIEDPPAFFYPIVNDFDGDGKSDIMIAALVYRVVVVPGHDDRYEPDHDSIIGISYGDGFAYQQMYITLSDYAPWYKEQINTDYNGDGKDDFCDGIDILTFNPYGKNQLITTIANGLNTKTKITYKNLTDNTVYTKGTGATYPLVNVASPFNVVWKVALDDGMVMDGYGMNSQYFYTDAKSHLRGKGYLGFTTISSTNILTRQSQLSTFELNTPYYFPVLKKTETFNDGTMLSQTIYTNAVKEFGNLVPGTNRKERIFSYVSGSNSNDLLMDRSTLGSYVYGDDFGNLTHSETDYKKSGSTQWSEVGDYTYENKLFGNIPIIGLLKTTTSVKTHPSEPGEDPFTNYSTFDYWDNGMLKSKTIEPGNTQSITENYEYWGSGNLKKTTTTAGELSRYVAYNYDGKMRFLISKTIDGVHFSQYVNEPKFGNVTKQIDANGLQTTFTYNAFGTALQTFFPDNTNASIATQFVNGTPDAPLHSLYYTSSVSTGNAPVVAFYDRLGQLLRTVTMDINNNLVYHDKAYNNKYYLTSESLPYFKTEAAQWINYTYDDGTSRILTKTGPGVNLSYAYSGCTVTLTDHMMGTSSSKTVDAIDNMDNSSDAGGTITYKYKSSGMPKTITDNGGNITTPTYDHFGRQTEINEPDAGVITYTYNAFGELVTQNSSKGQISLSYDNFGRVLTQTEPEGTTTYTYDTPPHGFGLLASVTATNGYAKTFTYDALNRPATETETIDGTPYTMSYTYNSNGKMNSMTYPNNYTISYEYKPNNGMLYQVKKPDNTPLWTLGSTNNFGQPTYFFPGNGLTTTYIYNNLGMLTNISTEGDPDLVQDLAYTYNTKQQLERRTDYKYNKYETFTYDNLNRLTSSTVNGQAPINISYNDMGNITSKTKVGDYSYNGVQPHAVTGVTNPDGLISTNPQVINYTSFNKVSKITENNNELTINYGAGKQRIKTVLKQNGVNKKTKYFAFDGAYEKIIDNRTGITKELCYLPGIKGYAAIYEKNITTQTQQLHYIHRDHQGSIQCITNESGIIEEEMSFDAWGNRRNATDWSMNNVPSTFMFDRGYTGHEQLDVFGLINMNGRMYDPKLGRMLSPDIVVQDAGNTQSYNRYSYCINNPLAYTDPSGYEAQCYLDDLMFWRANCASAPTMRNDAMYNLSLGGSVFNYIAGLSGNEYNTGAPTGGDYTNYVNSGNTNGFGNWFKQQTTANFNQPKGGNGGYWINYSFNTNGYAFYGFEGSNYKIVKFNVVNIASHWVMTDNNKTTSGGDEPNSINLSSDFFYPGVNIIQNKNIDQGYSNPFNNTIKIPGWAKSPTVRHDYILHEYGHYLQLKYLQDMNGEIFGTSLFIMNIMIPSMMSASNINHMNDWQEVNANSLANQWYLNYHGINKNWSFFDTITYKTK